MNYDAVRFGHQATGEDGAATGYVNEYDVTRAYGPYVISGLQRSGEKTINVTPPEAHRSLSDSLMYGVNLANSEGVNRFISCHANCVDDPQAHGCEVVYLSESGKILAESICNEIAALGFYNRGAKPDERGLAELHKTDSVAVIIEPFFISSAEDVALYQKIGPEKLGYAIVKGITGQEVQGTSNCEEKASTQTAATYEETVPTGPNIYQIPNMPFYIEKRADGDMSIHLDRGNYITLRKGGAPEVYWNNNKGSGGSKRLF